MLPPTMTVGTNCIWIGDPLIAGSSEFDNAKFNCTGPLSTPAQVRAAVNNQANWITSNGAPVSR
ncbi:MAG: hypothetical protein IPI66_01055 [Chitinophagaceae bacterium]|nr:hypothetical protein [Chitinophagaceae bacterium]